MRILYKYVTPERALTCIPEVGNGTLRATQLAALNDPFECHVVPLYVIPASMTPTGLRSTGPAGTTRAASCMRS